MVAEGATPAEGTMAVASGELDQFGHVQLGGIGEQVAAAIKERTGFDTRVTVLGHIQRGGTPTAFDRVLATRFGVAAVEAVHDGAFGQMVALQAGEIVRVPLAEAVGELKLVDPSLYHGVAEVFFRVALPRRSGPAELEAVVVGPYLRQVAVVGGHVDAVAVDGEAHPVDAFGVERGEGQLGVGRPERRSADRLDLVVQVDPQRRARLARRCEGGPGAGSTS